MLILGTSFILTCVLCLESLLYEELTRRGASKAALDEYAEQWAEHVSQLRMDSGEHISFTQFRHELNAKMKRELDPSRICGINDGCLSLARTIKSSYWDVVSTHACFESLTLQWLDSSYRTHLSSPYHGVVRSVFDARRHIANVFHLRPPCINAEEPRNVDPMMLVDMQLNFILQDLHLLRFVAQHLDSSPVALIAAQEVLSATLAAIPQAVWVATRLMGLQLSTAMHAVYQVVSPIALAHMLRDRDSAQRDNWINSHGFLKSPEEIRTGYDVFLPHVLCVLMSLSLRLELSYGALLSASSLPSTNVIDVIEVSIQDWQRTQCLAVDTQPPGMKSGQSFNLTVDNKPFKVQLVEFVDPKRCLALSVQLEKLTVYHSRQQQRMPSLTAMLQRYKSFYSIALLLQAIQCLFPNSGSSSDQ